MKKRCLLVLPRPVFPLVCGYALKNYHLIKILNTHYDLKIILISEKDISSEEQNFYESLSVEFYSYRIPKYKSYLSCAIGLFSSRPLQICYFYDRELQKKIDLLASESDILIAALIRTRKYFESIQLKANQTLVFDMVDSIALNYSRSKEHTSSLLWRFLYSIESKRLLKYERNYIQTSTITYLFNPEEVNFWNNAGNVTWLPHGVNNTLFTYTRTTQDYSNSVVFIGKMDYRPNVEAALWYLNNVHVIIGSKIPFIIVGAYPTEELQNFARKFPNVTITGYVDDPYVYMNSALAIVAPMQTGGGIQNKVLEGMALGKINIISPLAAASIVGAKNGVHFLIANSAEEYAEYIINIAQNPEQYQSIAKAAQELIKNQFTWEAYGRGYVEGINRTNVTAP